MALQRCSQILCVQAKNHGVRALSLGTVRSGLLDLLGINKPTPGGSSVGYQKLYEDTKGTGKDPMNFHNEGPEPLIGKGTKNDPYIVYSRNTSRLVYVQDDRYDEGGVPPNFWVTLEEGGRHPRNGSHFKLVVTPNDELTEIVDKYDLASKH